MTDLRLKVHGAVIPLESPKPWWEVVEIVGRHFFPNASPTGPDLPPPEKPKGRAR